MITTMNSTQKNASKQTPTIPSRVQLKRLARWYWLRLTLEKETGKDSKDSDKDIAFAEPDDELLAPSPEERKTQLEEHRRTCQNYRKMLARITPDAQRTRRQLIGRLQRLSPRLGLKKIDLEVLLLGAAAFWHAPLRRLVMNLEIKGLSASLDLLAAALRLREVELSESLRVDSRLVRSGLLKLEWGIDALNDCLQYSSEIANGLAAFTRIDEFLLHKAFRHAVPSKMDPADFDYIRESFAVIKAALTAGSGPAHVLIHGEPGVGKTALAHCLAAAMSWQAFEVRCEDDDRDPSSRTGRFKDYALGCRLLGKIDKTLVIFDEAEDVFTGDHWTHVSPGRDRHKGWTNRLLESTETPTVWISNSVWHIDPAYLRRFDYVLEMRPPPRSVRLKLLQQAMHGHQVSPQLLERLADSEGFTPADTDRIRRVLPRAVAGGITPENALTRLAICRPNGPTKQSLSAPRGSVLPYRLEWINVSRNLEGLIDGLRQRGCGTLLFSGPPGTGKSELARHIAKSLERPLLTCRASNLLNAYVGGTEARIAAAFSGAEQDQAVLLIDEADSFLGERSRAGESWEVSMVNEMLSQLDGYRGVAILTTNAAHAMDKAVLRRMDVKLEFDYLKPDHAAEAFEAAARSLDMNVTGESSDIVSQVREFERLSVGDLVAAMNSVRLDVAKLEPRALLKALSSEIALKGPVRRPIGFMGFSATGERPQVQIRHPCDQQATSA